MSIIVQAILAILAMVALGWGYVTGRSFDVYSAVFVSVVGWFGVVTVPATVKAYLQGQKPSTSTPDAPKPPPTP